MKLIWILWSILAFKEATADVGGHDLFTSLAQLEVLWHNDKSAVAIMEQAIKKLDETSQALKDYVTSHKHHTLDQEPNYDFLGHPVNAYHFVRHVASGWNKVRENLIGNNSLIEDLQKLAEREEEKLPDEYDVQGGAYGIDRLYSLYTFDLKSFKDSGIISTTLDDGQVVLSKPSVLKLNSYDYYTMATQACEAGLYDACTDFYQACLEIGQEELEHNVTLSRLFGYEFNRDNVERTLATAIKVHDHTLDHAGQRSTLHRCHKLPFDKKLRKKKKYKKATEPTLILGRPAFKEWEDKRKHDSNAGKEFNDAIEIQRDILCRKKEIRDPKEVAGLKCFYGHNGSPWLRVGPFKITENSRDPYHVIIHDLLFDHECNNITQFLGPILDFPPGRMNNRKARNDWTMKNCWPKENNNVFLEKLGRRIEHIAGLNANADKKYSEPYMCGNYGIGGHYWLHPDFHHPSVEHYRPGSSGNRVATILTVLENADAGGATVWPYAGISVVGQKGSALFWHNTYSSDIPDEFTMHVACPVLLGQKWIGNKWVGYNAQWNRRKCLLSPFDWFRPMREFQQL